MLLAILIQGLVNSSLTENLKNQHWKSTLHVPGRESATKLCNVFSTYFVANTIFVCLKHPELPLKKPHVFQSRILGGLNHHCHLQKMAPATFIIIQKNMFSLTTVLTSLMHTKPVIFTDTFAFEKTK